MKPALIGLVPAAAALLLPACGSSELSGPPVQLGAVDQVDAKAWAALAASRIWFGHQSVGYDVVAGLQDVAAARPQLKLNVVEGKDPGAGGPVFLHARIGENENPRSKIDDFVRTLEGGLGARVDVAAMKLCYIDFDASTDPEALFAYYRDAIARVRARFPALALRHFTVPLKQVSTGWKAQAKGLLGKPNVNFEANRKRARFSELLRAEYGAAVFDLAAVESSAGDGRRLLVTWKGAQAPALLPEYTRDGGHLNERGRARVAEQLLIFLARSTPGA